MVHLSGLLVALERYDTYPAEDALRAALEDVAAGHAPQASDPGQQAQIDAGWAAAQEVSVNLTDELFGGDEGQAAWARMVAWAEQRLNNWHSLKIAAFQAAFERDPSGGDLEEMRRAALLSLRQGLNDHPDMLADGHFLQALVRSGHQLRFNQVVKQLQADQVDIPQTREELRPFGLVCQSTFMYLIGTR